MKFKYFSKEIESQFEKMAKEQLYRVDVSGDDLFKLYLESFPSGTNPIYKERTQHDCNCCKNFIRDVGNVVSIKNGQMISIWDVEACEEFGVVAKKLSEFVKSKPIKNLFIHRQHIIGAEVSRSLSADKTVKTFNHFYCTVPARFVKDGSEYLSEVRSTIQVMERGLKELTDDSVDTVLDLISQNSLYRGEEHLEKVRAFRALKTKYGKLATEQEKNIFVWENYNKPGARIRNEVIGSLLIDLSENKELDHAVKSFESKVAPTNYKRPTALITKGMIDQAMKTINELGIEDSIQRRFAVPEDLSVNNVLFVNRETATTMKDSLASSLLKEVKPSTKDYSKVDEISIEEFCSKVLPNINSMEVFFEGKHKNNLMSLIAPENNSKNILKWNNNFSWSYIGNITDSIKERVKNAGGSIDGVLRVSLSWFNYDDLDLHCIEPGENKIYFSNKGRIHPSSGMLDVDMNAGGGTTREPVENIIWTNKNKMPKGIYKIKVHNFSKRETKDVGFIVQTECNGKMENYSYSLAVGNQITVPVIDLHWNGETVEKVTIHDKVDSASISKTVWGIDTEKFHKVNILTISPNHWDENKIGNKHYFFIIEGCLNEEDTRGIYNEFLSNDLDKHRKVFEVIGNKMKVPMSDKQLSGLGFSSTKKDSVICKVSGNFNRVLKITF